MLRKTTTSGRSARSGYTLMEMLMVQGMIVALVGLSWPALRNPLGKNELLDAARQVRIELAKTRLRAIETGTPQEFRYQLGGSDFGTGLVSNSENHNSLSTASQNPYADPMDVANTTSIDLDEEGNDQSQRVSLPSGVRFTDALDNEEAEFATADATTDDSMGVELNDGEGLWSQPIVFYPNGRASNRSIRLSGKEPFYVEVALRGLTGEASVGEIRKQKKDEAK